MEVEPALPPALLPSKMDQTPPKNLQKAAARRAYYQKPQPDQVLHQPSNVEPQWACTYKRWGHNKAYSSSGKAMRQALQLQTSNKIKYVRKFLLDNKSS